MAKKDKKAKQADKKVRVAQKQEKKTVQKEKKTKAKKGDDSDAEDVDLDAVLAEYAKQQEQFLKVTEVVCEPPSARASSTVVGSPVNDNELFVFGGEYFNGALARFYNDLFVYNTNRDEWKKVTSPNTPLPRSGHAWCRGGNDKSVYLFGGEFSSPKQGTFYHYNDFWKLDPSTREWTKLESKKGPPARSGHRMTYFKNYIILFGGFQDTSSTTKYLADLWVYDTYTFTWHAPPLPPASAKPDARSSFSFLPHESGAVIYGGYSRVKTAVGSASSRPTKSGGGAGSQGGVLKPMVHQDAWFLRVVPPADNAAPNIPPTVRWERRKRPANPPNPTRAGCTMAHHKGRGIMFGGVHDVEASEEGIESEFFNTLYVWNVDRNRYFTLALRRARGPAKKALAGGGFGPGANERARRGGRQKADEEELLRNLAALEARETGGAGVVDVPVTQAAAAEEDEMDKDARPEKLTLWEMPHPRFNAQLAVQDDVLYIFGGTYEKGDREYTFDEMYAVDLGKLDGVKQIFRRELEDWHGSEDEDSDDDEDDEDDEGSDDEDGNNVEEEHGGVKIDEVSSKHATTSVADDDETEAETPSTPSSMADGLPYPRPFETLRDFFARTSIAWQETLLEALRKVHWSEQKKQSIKEIRKGALERAEQKWWDCREEIQALEDEQEASGIGEVVNLADKEKEGGGAPGAVGRRR